MAKNIGWLAPSVSVVPFTVKLYVILGREIDMLIGYKNMKE